MVTYYCISLEEALRRAKIAGRQPGCYYGGIILRSGKKGFAVYRNGKVIEQYSVRNYQRAAFTNATISESQGCTKRLMP